MSFYECAGNLYSVDPEGGAHPLSVTAKDKVTEVRQIESITTDVSDETVTLPKGARPISIGEAVAKFNLNESNPITFDEDVHEAQLSEVATEVTATPETEQTSEQESVTGEPQQTTEQEPVTGEPGVAEATEQTTDGQHPVFDPTVTNADGFEAIGTVDGTIENPGTDDDSLFAGV